MLADPRAAEDKARLAVLGNKSAQHSLCGDALGRVGGDRERARGVTHGLELKGQPSGCQLSPENPRRLRVWALQRRSPM
jgi:hypothetical protein